MDVPSFKIFRARQIQRQNFVMVKVWGGLGDQICSEPAIRFALNNFKNQKISLSAKNPELFYHLHDRFEEVFNADKDPVNYDNYLTVDSMCNPQHLLWAFCSHMVIHPVDFPSILMWQRTLHNSDKEIQLPDFAPTEKVKRALEDPYNTVVVHFGASMPSKTFPLEWCERMVASFKVRGFKVVLIGKEVDEKISYVKVNGEGCVDLRDNLSLQEFVWLLKNCKFLFSNDSSPIHAAAAGDAFIGMVSSIKHPDYLFHWRKGQFGYKTKNFGLDGAWNHVDCSPVQDKDLDLTNLIGVTWDKILPSTDNVADYYSRLRGS